MIFYYNQISTYRFQYFKDYCIFNIFKIFKSQEKLTNTSFVLSILLVLIFAANILGLIPIGVSITTQLIIILPLALVNWSSCILSNLFFNYKNFFRHLIPKGVTISLSPILSIVELIRQFLRPITLAVRLVANITVGHVVLALIIITLFSNIFRNLLIAIFIFLA
jgi:ATP synthase subunit 6